MAWIKNLEGITKKDNTPIFYEIASEVFFSDNFSYEENGIEVMKMKRLTMEKDSRGLYHYQLMIRCTWALNNGEFFPKGYYFDKREIGELLVLFSVFLQARFYLLAHYVKHEEESLGVKVEYDEINLYKDFKHKDAYQIFRDKSKGRRTFKNLKSFLDDVRSLDDKLHLDFILACDAYMEALKEIGDKKEDEEKAYIKLVSSIEVLAKNFKIKNLLNGLKFDELISIEDEEIRKELKKILDVNKSGKISKKNPTRKFREFIKYYSNAGFFIGEKYKNKEIWTYKYVISKNNIDEHLENIYDARSKYLHSGKSMFLSHDYISEDCKKMDISAISGLAGDRRMIIFRKSSGKKVKYLLPYLFWFESLVRHCLLNYLKYNSKK